MAVGLAVLVVHAGHRGPVARADPVGRGDRAVLVGRLRDSNPLVREAPVRRPGRRR
ncbi:hypothetical protein FHX69_5436 [Prauserella muralis]|nr:hypothetical protein FHX69_5436 [Prauserella muralis]